MGVADDPVGENTAAAPASYSHPGGVYEITFEDLVHSRHQILVVVAGIVVLDDVGEVLTIRRAAARIGVDDDVAFGRHPVELVGEGVAVGSVGSAVDLEDHRIFFRRAESGRLEYPAL